MSDSRMFTIDVDAEYQDSSSDGEAAQDVSLNPFMAKIFADLDFLTADVERKRAAFLETLKEGYVEPERKEKITADTVCNFIRADTSVQAFYDYVTRNGSDFSYCLNARESRVGGTALMAACQASNVALVAALLAAGVSPNQCTEAGCRPLDVARDANNKEIIGMLTRAGARFGIANYSGQLSEYRDRFRDAVVGNDVAAARTLLAEHPYEIDLLSVVIQMSHFCTRQAVMNGNFELVKLLVEHDDNYIEDDHISEKSNIVVARDAGFDDIADYLEQKQREVYRQLRAQIQVEKPHEAAGTVHHFFAFRSPDASAEAEVFTHPKPGFN